jgi:hypothetical protein
MLIDKLDMDLVRQRVEHERQSHDPGLRFTDERHSYRGVSRQIDWVSGGKAADFCRQQALYISGAFIALTSDPNDPLGFQIDDPEPHMAAPPQTTPPPPARPAAPAGPQQKNAAPPARPGVPANPQRQRPTPAPRAARRR